MIPRSRAASFFAVASALLALGCVIEPARTVGPPPPPPAQPQTRVAARPAPIAAERSVPQRLWVEPLAAGYMYCCGNQRYRLEIGCIDLDMKCYEQTPEGWQWTYGRHCKDQLGSACYLNGCDERCD
ncbi:MAG TPA: hypothetical protein VML75_08480 [Kofleriaceae bacterium]|nr:hypothetical protein [Kofleriaceae bacterium]